MKRARKIDKRVVVGIPQELYDALKELAEAEFRSVPNYIWYLLQEHVEKK